MKKRSIVGLLTACFLFAGMVGTTHAVPVQWTTGSGGNGHWYDVVQTNISWSAAASATEGRTDLYSSDWHLATTTSQAEQDFIASLLAVYSTIPGDAGFQIGGFQPAGSTEPSGGWQWVTGEAFSSYNGWGSPPEPNNSSDEGYLYVDERYGWRWNDYVATSSYYRPTGYIAEAPSAVPEPSTMLLLGSGLLGLVGLNRRRKA